MNIQEQTALVALVVATVAAACAVPGVFLVQRRLVMLGDAISHVLLFGIVIAYLIVRDLSSPLLLLGAGASGVLTVVGVELLQRTRHIRADAAVGLVYPVLFSIGTIIATIYLRDTHLDIDSVLLGSAELAPFEVMRVGGRAVGPVAFYIVGVCFLTTAALVAAFYKELKVSTFDVEFAAALGFAPAVMHYALMVVTSLTTVASFDAVGPVLVVAFFAVPPLTARQFTARLGCLLFASVAVGVLGGILGTLLAFRLSTPIAGTTAGTLGGLFALAVLFAPREGLLATAIRRRSQRREFAELLLLGHLQRHEGTPAEPDEAARLGVHRHLNWTESDTTDVVERVRRRGFVREDSALLKLTDDGRRRITIAFGDIIPGLATPTPPAP